jgi:hypothetical protein
MLPKRIVRNSTGEEEREESRIPKLVEKYGFFLDKTRRKQI